MMVSHQRAIRDKEAARDPRAVVPLDGSRVVEISRDEAAEVILRYEWLGTMNKVGVAYYGLRAASGDLLGAACFGIGNGTAARDVCGAEWADRTIALERGACVHYAHEHAGSKLVAGAVRLIAEKGYNIVFAYSDSEAGEIGTIYQACNWLYLGVGPGRSGHRWKARHKGGPWQSSRLLRSRGVKGPDAWAALRADPDWELAKDLPKGKYVTFTGNRRDKKAARAALRYPPLPYPKRGQEQ